MIRRLLVLLFALCLLAPILTVAPADPPRPAQVTVTVPTVPASPAPTRASRSRHTPTPSPPAAAASNPTRVAVGASPARPKSTGIAGRVADCESGDRRRDGTAIGGTRRYHTVHYPDGSSSASGAYGFLDGTWTDVTGRDDRAYQAPAAVQDAAFRRLHGQSGLRPWAASRSCWSRR